ncbi:MAG: prolyl oligopeptidase family serine peptidase [Anaerolineae bacterium]|nr:prolyl oligopeptidase family serine peptidase [Thermoflexales bacterium]MDW8406898.1 prolyl oligopeptidase family serine peptidase [Anaerolineae bacterium]
MLCAPFGSWKSPITADLVVAGSLGLMEPTLDGEDVYWTEMRPTEKGRYVVVRRTSDGVIQDVTPPTYNARTRVHEYGGGATRVRDGAVYFSNFADQRLYCQLPGQAPQPLTPATDPPGALRYAAALVDARRNRLICVREDHRLAGHEPANTLVAVPLDGREDAGAILIEGHDFYASPRLSPDGSQLAWLAWNHPNMPWDGTELWLADVTAQGGLTNVRCVAGGRDESIFQPEWSPDGVLYFVSDRSGWWNVYRLREGHVEALAPMQAEFGLPQWGLGMSTYAFESAERLVCTYTQNGLWHLSVLDTRNGALQSIDAPFTSIHDLRAAPGRVTFVGATPRRVAAVVVWDISAGQFIVLRTSNALDLDEGYLSLPEPLEFPTEGGLTAHGLFYAPRNRDYEAPAGEKPPLLVISHGGPTGATSSALNLSIQYWTSRGFAVLDVNYGGSTGYGRAYRQRLNGNWGIVDVDDCCNGALHLARQGRVDGNRLVIRGRSAGGYTALAALTFRNVFHAGASYYGISDLETLAVDTHKFESRYLDSLIGPYPERRDLYRARSPIYAVDRLNCPVIFFQGLEDRVVPPDQAERMVEALRRKGLPVAYVPFEGEQHGFRQAGNIKRALEAELYFYSRVFGFEPAESLTPVRIDNLPDTV